MSPRAHITASVVISTHQMTYGAPQALRDYFLEKNNYNVSYIGHPLLTQRVSSCHQYTGSAVIKEYSFSRKVQLGVIDYILDFLLTCWWILFLPNKQTLFIGVDPLNCIAGLTLQKLGKVDKVIYYAIDFVPIRFKNNTINKIFHFLEKYCVMHANETWNVSPRIASGRQQFLGISMKKYPQKVVPIGIWYKKIKREASEQIKPHQLLFIGHLLEKQGVQLVLQTIPRIIQKIPDFHFLVIGGGEYEKSLKQIVKQLQIEPYVTFKGWVTDRKELNRFMNKSTCAIAIYKPEKEKLYNFTYYADPTKLKDYLGAGLPIILTDISYNAQDIQKNGCGIVVEYKVESVEQAIMELLSNRQNLLAYRKNALQYAKQFDWNQIFANAFSS